MQIGLIDKLQVWGFEDEITLFKDSSMGFGFRLEPHDVAHSSDEDINHLKEKLKNFLGSLPAHIDLQFVQSIEKGGKDTLQEHLSFSKNSPTLVKHLAQERLNKFNALEEEGKLPQQFNYLLVRIPLKDKNNLEAKIFSLSTQKNEKITMMAFKKGLHKANQLQNEIERQLIAAGFHALRLEPSETAKLIFDSWNPNHLLGLSQFDESDIRDRVVVSDLVKSVKGFRLGSTYHRVISLKILPEYTFAGMASGLVNLPFSSKLYLSIHVPDQNKEIDWMKLNRRMAYAMVVGKKGVSDVESNAKLQDIEELLNEVVKLGEKILSASMNIVLRSEVEEDLIAQTTQVLQVIRELGGSEGIIEDYAAFDIFAEITMPNAIGKERSRKIKSSNLADLLPVFGLWQGFDKPSVLLRTRMGSLFKFDPFSPRLTNANQIISGGSGSGKSYLTNLMIGQMLSQNPKVYVVDIGGSYQKTCELLNGQYVHLSMDSGISMNPFDLPEGCTIPTDEKIKFLSALVQIMTKEDDQTSIGKLEKAEVERLIQTVYQEESTPRLSHLQIRLVKSEIPEVQRIGKILSLWCGNTPYGKFVDQPTTIQINSSMVSFDLKGLESHSDLQAACLFIITDLVWRTVQKDRSEMKFLIFDESWRLLESDAGSQFVGEVFRTFRKYYASAIAISQNIDDFAKSKAASAIMPNSSVKWILKQSGADFKRLAEVLRLNEREISQVQSLTQVKGQYSEAYLICEDKKAVVSVESTPIEYWLATTDPRDYALMKKEQSLTQKEGLELIQHLSQNYPMGSI